MPAPARLAAQRLPEPRLSATVALAALACVHRTARLAART